MPRRPVWTDKLLIFLSGLQKLEQRAKKCIELREEYVEQIPSLVAVACFLPGRTKDLSAPPRTPRMKIHLILHREHRCLNQKDQLLNYV